MYTPTTSIKIELGIEAQKIIQQIQINNKLIEEQIQKGIELALNDIIENNNFVEQIRETTKIELGNIVNRAIMSWEVRNSIHKAVETKLADKIDSYAEKLVDKIIKSIEK